MIRIKGLEFCYGTGGFELNVPQLKIARGETVAVIGPSGSGKTTLLNLLAGILRPGRGHILVEETDLASVDDHAARNFRAERIGLVFQEFELLEYLNVLDNILLPFRINRRLRLSIDARNRAEALVARTGISDKLHRFPDQLSQGERQRVAVCRALIAGPKLLLADEPTGNLDPQNKDKVLHILLDCGKEQDVTLVIVTHDHELIPHFDRIIDFSTLTTPTAQDAA
jgi:putative ABC transport system ATP-binding protein